MTDKINILHLVTSLNVGGTEKYLLSVTKALKGDFNFFVGYLKQEGRIADELKREGIQVYRLNNLYNLFRFLKKNKIYILHTHLYRANIIGRIMGKVAKVPVIVSSQRSIDGWKKFYHVLLDRITARFNDCIIANSQETKKILITREKIDSNKISVIHNGININDHISDVGMPSVKAKLKIGIDIPVIGYVGRLHTEKGVDLIPEIALRLKQNIPVFKFVIIGEGPFKKKLARYIEKYGLTDNISLLGYKQNILDFIAIMDIVILPSREESFPQVVLEAMKMAKPVVAADVGGVKELVIDGVNGILVPSCNTEVFVKAICRILQDKDNAYAMGKAGRKYVIENFGIDRMIKETEQIYNKFIDEKIRINQHEEDI